MGVGHRAALGQQRRDPHIATLNIPWTAAYNPDIDWDPVKSFVIVRNLDAAVDPEILRDNRWHGAEHDIWSVGWPAGNYRAELHSPHSCQEPRSTSTTGDGVRPPSGTHASRTAV
ncbi:hypothetical protein SAMN05661093_10033 [Kibdelosporangium aridum]|uniref:Uncharacterized protein n=1 Tax=Kibdelosporangium aridum TaxID=2030 RepID=A0A1W2FWZ3_KIBAR|nr:hypothetical protein SAMN05661093_10033 [Kibdelosporangium aridum]